MQNSVMYELTVFSGAGAAGVLLAFFYDLFRLKRRFIKTTRIMVHVEDIIFWICAAIVLFLSSYILSSGETRAYFFGGAFIGGALYLGILSKPVLLILSIAIRILLWPFMEILKFMRPIIRKVYILFRRMAGKIRNQAAMKGYRMRVSYTRLRNTFTKK